jgi:hypothetical protein
MKATFLLFENKSIFKYMFLIFATAFMLSCSKDEEPDSPVTPPAGTGIEIQYAVNPSSNQRSISNLIYGIGYYNNEDAAFVKSATFIRFGGNNTTPYNWEINASNAGEDWYHSSYYYGSGREPAAIYNTVIDGALKSNKTPMITMPMIYSVVADANGSVLENDPVRWKTLKAKKPNADFVFPPITTDGEVYVDECVHYLTNKYGKGKIKYSMDNEPELWYGTHSHLLNGSGKPGKIACKELLDRTFEFAKAIKDVDEQAELFGFVSYGFNGYLSLQGAPDWESLKQSNSWFIDYYLKRNAEELKNSGRRLIDVLDLHWYPSESGDNPINKRGVVSTENDKKVRMQAPRRLWDPEYVWNDWVQQYYSSFMPIIPRLQSSINQFDSQMKLAFSEFQFGGYDDISGTITLADVLGIYGRYGVYAANHWGTPGPNGFLAYDLYCNYDGSKSTFGNTSVRAVMGNKSDKLQSSIYASINDKSTNQLHLIVLNKNMEKPINGKFAINEPTHSYSKAQIFAVEGEGKQIVSKGEVDVKDNKFEYSLPAMSVAHIVLK